MSMINYFWSGIGNLRTRRVAPLASIVGAISSPLVQCKKVIFPLVKCLKIKSISSLSFTWPPLWFCQSNFSIQNSLTIKFVTKAQLLKKHTRLKWNPKREMKKEIKMKRYLVAEIDGVLSFGLKVATPRCEGNHCWRTKTTPLHSLR